MPKLLSLALLVAAAAVPAWAQRPVTRADSAWAAEDRELARRLYEEELARDPDNSHATFRLATLAPEPRAALRLYQRYTVLEPSDAWGWMAVGDQFARLGKTSEALAMYDRAARLAPGERDVTIGRARVLSRAGRREAAAAEYEGWIAAHPADREAWGQAGREWLRAGKPGRAARAFARAAELGLPGAKERLEIARAQRAVAFEPGFGYVHDSDGNHIVRFSLLTDWAVGDGTRLGVAGLVSRIEDATTGHLMQQGFVRIFARPRSPIQLTLSAGATRLDRGLVGPAWITPTGEARLRWHAPAGGPLLDIRAERLALGATPLLLENRAARNETRATGEVPFGPFRLRGGGRAGSITAAGQSNTRWGADGALVVPLSWKGEISTQYHRLHYAKSATVGYFAPDQVETVEGGAYLELGGPTVSLAVDLGTGAQRLREHGTGYGPWRLALRGWSYLTVPFAQGPELRLELEGYDAPFAPEGVATSEHWKYLAISLSIRWVLP